MGIVATRMSDKGSFLDEMLSLFNDNSNHYEKALLLKKLEKAVIHTLTTHNSFKILNSNEQFVKAELASSYFQSGDFYAALHIFQNLIINQPHNPTWWVYVAGCYIALTEHHKAFSAARIAYILNPDEKEIQELYSLTKEYIDSINIYNSNIISAS